MVTESSMVPLPKAELTRFENSSITLRGEQADALATLLTFEFETVQVDSTGRVVQPQTKTARYFQEDLGQGVILDMVSIPDGKFKIGSPEDEEGRNKSEGPQRWVKVPSFFMGQYPVTQAQWRAVAALDKVERDLDADPSNFKGHFKGNNYPVETVSWYDVVEFCARLSAHTGRQYRLPSEAEWEYACRARTTTPFSFGEKIIPNLTNYGANSGGITSVAFFRVANAFGLCDMHGNVKEWCLDHWRNNYEDTPLNSRAWITTNEKTDRITRGGSAFDAEVSCRSASRFRQKLEERDGSTGFRIVCTTPRIQINALKPIADDIYKITDGIEQEEIQEKLDKERSILLLGKIESSLADSIVIKLKYLDIKDPTKPIYLYINSPGGSVEGFFSIYDTMQMIKAPVITICIGLAGGMAGSLLSGGAKGRRSAMPHTQIMIRSPLGVVAGNAGDDIETLAMKTLRVRNLCSRVLAIGTGKLVEQIERDIERDFFMSAQEAMDYGLIDQVISDVSFRGFPERYFDNSLFRIGP